MLQNAAVVAIGSFAILILAYFTYGKFLARRIYRLRPDRPTPSHTLTDGIDYVPTRVPVLFGHHFASIAGLGPILGPAVAVIWGWVPAVIWVVLGCIFIGAVHDLGALTVSLRYKGRSIGDACHHLMGPRARLLALVIIFFLMSLAMGAFVNAISALFVFFRPDAIIPSLGLMVVAATMGLAVNKFRVPLAPATIVALLLFAGLIFWGVEQPVATYEWFLDAENAATVDNARALAASGEADNFPSPYGADAAKQYFASVATPAAARVIGDIGGASQDAVYAWIGVLLGYAFLASVLPVWLLLQPRDYINSFQLYFALATMLVGLIVAAAIGAPEAHIDAVAFRPNVPLTVAQPAELTPGAETAQAPLGEPTKGWLPLLFVTIACGAVSGFHSLVSSGTTVKQLDRESDALSIGYGAMLTEGALAILVILACTAGLGAAAWQMGGPYEAWSSIGGGGLGAKLNAVVHGGANFLGLLHIPALLAQAILAVTIVSFALTTLDSATRLLRFNVEEICRSVRLDPLANRYFASAVAVAGIAFFGLIPAGPSLWVLFGGTNQLLAGLTLLTVSVFLYKLHRPVAYTVVPMVLMLGVSVWALLALLWGFIDNPAQPWRWTLTGTTVAVLLLAFWLIVEALLSLRVERGGVDEDEPPTGPSPTDHQHDQAVDAAHLG